MILKKKQTLRLLFISPDMANMADLLESLKGLPIQVVFCDTDKAYIVDTGLKVYK